MATTYLFSALVHNEHLVFDPDADILRFDLSSMTASAVTLSQDGANLGFTHSGKTVWLHDVTLGQISDGSIVFDNGSSIVAGDLTSDILLDWLGQDYSSLAAVTVDMQLWGLGGADAMQGGTGNDLLVSSTVMMPLDHVSRIGSTGSPTGTQAPTISADGNLVAFTGGWTQFGSANENATDVLVKDLAAGTVSNEHKDDAGQYGGSGSGSPVISADGSILVFSSASTLVGGINSNALYDIYAASIGNAAIELVSTGSGGELASDGRNIYPDVSADGRYVVFQSATTNWAAGGNSNYDIFLKDRVTGTLTRITTSLGGSDGNGDSEAPQISADGRYVVFQSAASDLTANDTNGYTDVFLWDSSSGGLTNLTDRMNPATVANPNNGCFSPDIGYDSGYGGVVVFQTGKGLVAEDTHNSTDIYAYYIESGTFALVSATAAGTGVGVSSTQASISGDGRYVVFAGGSDALVNNDSNGSTDIFVKDLATGNIALVSRAADGSVTNLSSGSAEISLGGDWIVFESSASTLASTDANGTTPDIFRISNPLLEDTLIGGAGNDVLTAAEGNETLRGDAGNDVLSGGAGSDIAIFSGNRSGYTLSLGADGTVVLAGTDGTDTFTGIEQLQFDDATLSLVDALPDVQLTTERHYAKVHAYFLGVLGREATDTEADQFVDVLLGNQSRVWWNADQSVSMGTDSLMGYLMAQTEYLALSAQSHDSIVGTVFSRLTGQAASQELIDHYVARLDAGTLRVQGVVNKMLGELYLSPKGDGTLGTVAGFTDNRGFLDGEAYRGYLDNLDAIIGIDITNLDNGNLVELVGVTN